MLAILGPCAAVALAQMTPPITPLSPDRIRVLVKKLEEPTRHRTDARQGPPDYPPSVRDFKYHWDELRELERAGADAIPPLVALFEDRTKPGPARAHAAQGLTAYLSGYLNEPDARALAAVRAAIKDKDPAVREGVLIGLIQRGWSWNLGDLNSLSPFRTALAPSALRAVLPDMVVAVADSDPAVAVLAARAVRYHDRGGVGVPELLAALKRQEGEVRAAAIITLGEVGRADLAVLPAILQQLANKDAVESYAAAVGTVGRFGPAAKGTVPQLIEALKDMRSTKNIAKGAIPARAAESLGAIGPGARAAVPALLARFRSGMLSYGSRRHLMDLLDRIEPAAAREARAIEQRSQEEFRRRMMSSPAAPVLPLASPFPPTKPQ